MSVQTKASRIRLLLFDVDGVLTTGEVVMHADGSESKGFHIRDGAGIVWAQRAGLTVGLLSARSSGATAHRAAQLAIRIVEQGVRSKLVAYEQMDQADVAKVLGVSEQNVRTNLHLARERLRQRLARYLEPAGKNHERRAE